MRAFSPPSSQEEHLYSHRTAGSVDRRTRRCHAKRQHDGGTRPDRTEGYEAVTEDPTSADAVIARLTRAHPRARVVALSAEGIPYCLPAEVPIPAEMRDDRPEGLSPFDLDDLPILLAAFAETQKHGSAAT